MAGMREKAGRAQRKTVRARLLDLFETVGPSDPAVVTARRHLMTALF